MRALNPLAIFVSSVNAHTTTITIRSTTVQTALLELYTSEGCSSCSPRLARAVRVTRTGHLEPIQAAGGWLRSGTE